MKRVSMIVSGRVQGVGFRAYVQDIALGMNINGWVRNLPDGSVEIEAEGPDEAVERFILVINQSRGDFIYVDTLQKCDIPISREQGFFIRS